MSFCHRTWGASWREHRIQASCACSQAAWPTVQSSEDPTGAEGSCSRWLTYTAGKLVLAVGRRTQSLHIWASSQGCSSILLTGTWLLKSETKSPMGTLHHVSAGGRQDPATIFVPWVAFFKDSSGRGGSSLGSFCRPCASWEVLSVPCSVLVTCRHSALGRRGCQQGRSSTMSEFNLIE